MKRSMFLGALTTAALLAAPGVALAGDRESDTVVCIPESLFMSGPAGNTCLAVATPAIDPPFRAASEHNGSQVPWCLYTGQRYTGFVLIVPPFSGTNVFLTVASGRPC